LSHRLFASTFLSPVIDGPEQPQSVYDEERSLNVGADGRPQVESVPTAQTRTVTEARVESDDRHREDGALAATLGTVTKVSGEPPDSFGMLGTDTRVRGERADYSHSGEDGRRPAGCRGGHGVAGLLGTNTAVVSEGSDPGEERETRFAERPSRESVQDELHIEAPTSVALGVILRG